MLWSCRITNAINTKTYNLPTTFPRAEVYMYWQEGNLQGLYGKTPEGPLSTMHRNCCILNRSGFGLVMKTMLAEKLHSRQLLLWVQLEDSVSTSSFSPQRCPRQVFGGLGGPKSRISSHEPTSRLQVNSDPPALSGYDWPRARLWGFRLSPG